MKIRWLKLSLLVVLALSLIQGCYVPPPQQASEPFTIEVSVDKNIYRIGETIVISVRSNRDCYLTLYDISTEGEVTQIFPNKYASDSMIQGGYTYRIPDQADQFDFEITGPPGVERVRAVGTVENVNFFDERQMDRMEDFPKIYQNRPGEFDSTLSEKLEVMPSERWAEASVTFQIK